VGKILCNSLHVPFTGTLAFKPGEGCAQSLVFDDNSICKFSHPLIPWLYSGAESVRRREYPMTKTCIAVVVLLGVFATNAIAVPTSGLFVFKTIAATSSKNDASALPVTKVACCPSHCSCRSVSLHNNWSGMPACFWNPTNPTHATPVSIATPLVVHSVGSYYVETVPQTP
jgi:hypothetical protein